MLNDNCLRALARGAEEGFERAAVAEIARLDPMLRPGTTRRVREVIARAHDLVGPECDGLDEAHRLRIAFLLATERLHEISPTDRAEVERAYAVARKGVAIGKRRPWFYTLLTVLVVTGSAASIGYLLLRPTAEQSLRNSDIGQALGPELSRWQIALGSYERARLDDNRPKQAERKDEARDHRNKTLELLRTQLGDEAADHMDGAMTLHVKRLRARRNADEATEHEHERDDERDDERMFEALQGINQDLEGRKLLVDYAFVNRSTRALVSFHVLRRSKVRFEGETKTVIVGRRFDELVVNGLLRARPSEAVEGMLFISLDGIENRILPRLFFALAEKRSWDLAGKRADGDRPLMALERRAAEVAREEVLPAAGLEPSDIVPLAGALTRRAELITALRGRQVLVPEPGTFWLRAGLRYSLEEHNTDALERDQLLEVDDELAGQAPVFNALLSVFAAAEQAYALRYYEYLEHGNHLGEPSVLEGDPDLKRTRAELAARLGTIASPKCEIPLTMLTMWIEELIVERGQDRPSARSMALTRIQEEVGSPTTFPGDSLHDVAEHYAKLMTHDRDAIRDAASAAYKRLFDQEPADSDDME